MSAGVGRFIVNGQVDQLDEGLEQDLKLMHQLAVAQRNRRLRGERLSEALVRLGELDDAPRFGMERIDQLQHANDFVLVVFHRHGQKRLGTIAGTLIEMPRPGKIKAFGNVGVSDVDGVAGQRGIGRHHAVVGCVVFLVQGQVGKLAGGWLAARTAKRQVQRIGTNDLEMQMLLVLGKPVERPPVSSRNGFGSEQDFFQQQIQVALVGERGPNIV